MYFGFLAAAKINDGFVVASCGLNFFMASKSPVSATTIVIKDNCSKMDFIFN